MRLVDLVGQRFTRLTVIERAPNKSLADTNARWLCSCDCGKTCIAYGQDLRRGKFKSCGCLNAERIQRHGMARTHVYNVWKQMHQRCENPRSPSFKNYGARGIKVDPAWKDFEVFLRDMGDRPPGYTLERLNNNLGYSKANCGWRTQSHQMNNTRRNRLVTFNGETKTIMQWSVETNIKWYTLRQRIDRLGWSIEKALSTPPK